MVGRCLVKQRRGDASWVEESSQVPLSPSDVSLSLGADGEDHHCHWGPVAPRRSGIFSGPVLIAARSGLNRGGPVRWWVYRFAATQSRHGALAGLGLAESQVPPYCLYWIQSQQNAVSSQQSIGFRTNHAKSVLKCVTNTRKFYSPHRVGSFFYTLRCSYFS
ncbi:hypothetical protein LY78DRAFT_464135 [Colletotrichum sublineola]|nr:hypothetical protein LY78DRAFT_464135 [Colletotrichum sublineola]